MLAERIKRYPFLRLLLPVVIGILCGDAWPNVLPDGAVYMAAVFMAVACFLPVRRYKGWLFGCTAFLFFALLGYSRAAHEWQQTDFPFPAGQPSTYRIRITEPPEEKERSLLCRSVVLEEWRNNSILQQETPPLFLLYFPKDSATHRLKRGDELLIQAQLAAPRNNGNPDEFDYARFLRRRGVSGTAYIPDGQWKWSGHHPERTAMQTARDYRDSITHLYRRLGFEGDNLAVLSALTVGDKDDLSEDIIETYSVSGASHVLALSGMHIGFLYALFWLLFSPLWRRWKVLKLPLLLLLIGMLWAFAFLTGLSSSVVRSVVMFTILALSTLQRQKPLTLNTLAATAFLMLCFRPLWLFDVGFQLSFAAVAGILLFRPLSDKVGAIRCRPLRYVAGICVISIAAQIGTAPLVMLYFSRFSTHFLVTNLWVIPLVSLILYAAVLMLLLTPFPSLQTTVAQGVASLVDWQNRGLHYIEGWPYASIDHIWLSVTDVLLFYTLLCCLWLLMHRFTAGRLTVTLGLMCVMAGWSTVQTWQNRVQPGIVFYNQYRCPAVHCLAEGGRSWLVCADSVPHVERLERNLSVHWNRLKLPQPQLISGTCDDKSLDYHDQIVTFAGHKVCMMNDNRWQKRTARLPLAVDILYISRGYRGGLSEVTPALAPGRVVIDASLSPYYRQRIIGDCIRLAIPYHDLSRQGAFRLPVASA